MEQVPAPNAEPDGNSKWPAFTMMFVGTFGSRTPAGRRYHRQCWIAFMILSFVVFTLLVLPKDWIPDQARRLLMALLPGGAFTYIAWAFNRYLQGLDELARRLQLEAIARTYLIGIAVAALLGGFALAYNWGQWFLNPIWFITLEPVRGAALYWMSRRY